MPRNKPFVASHKRTIFARQHQSTSPGKISLIPPGLVVARHYGCSENLFLESLVAAL
jgi:hypothetical protein